MKRFFLPCAAALLAALPLHAAPSDDEVAARRLAAEVAGAFTNEGFKLRDGTWFGVLEVGKPKVIQVNLYAGNEYWFTLASVAAAKKLQVTVYDEAGKAVEVEPFQDESVAAAGFSPETSGAYYVKVEELEGTKAAFCLIYSYK